MPTRRIRDVAVALGVTTALAACGADGAGDAPTSSTTTSVRADAAAADAAGAASTGSTPVAPDDLEDVLLTVEDLDGEWVEAPPGSEADLSLFWTFVQKGECSEVPSQPIPHPTQDEAVDLTGQGDDDEQQITSAVGQFAEGEAAGWLDAVTERFVGCRGTTDQILGLSTTPLAGLGDEAVLLAADVVVPDGEGSEGRVDVAAARAGEVIVLVASFTAAADEVDEEALLATMVDRL